MKMRKNKLPPFSGEKKQIRETNDNYRNYVFDDLDGIYI